MIVLAIDTCDSQGSVAVVRDGEMLAVAAHEATEDYSIWLLPAVSQVLTGSSVRMAEVDAYAVAAGPGSFTGVRVGLTTVKAWSEVFGKSIAAVSRMESIATQATGGTEFVAAFADAQRGQVFGAVFRRKGAGLERLGDEMVIAPGKFVEAAVELARDESIEWVSKDAGCVIGEEAWKVRERRGEKVESVSSVLAPAIGRVGWAQLVAGRNTDALALDANYVRRSDAEIFWKGGAASR